MDADRAAASLAALGARDRMHVSEEPMTSAVVPIRLGRTWLLVHAESVREFLASTRWLSVPGSTPLMPGVMTWRGRAIPVVDLPRSLGVGVITPTEHRSRVLVVQHAVGVVAVPVDGAREVVMLPADSLRPPHLSTTPYTLGEVEQGDEVLPVIDLEQLLKDLGKASAGT